MSKKRKVYDQMELELSGFFDSPERMAEEMDSLLHFLQKKYTQKESEVKSILGFIVTDLEVVFVEGISSVKLRSDLASNCLYICAPAVNLKDKEGRKLELLNAFSTSIKKNQLASIVELLYFMSPLARQKLLKTYSEHMKALSVTSR